MASSLGAHLHLATATRLRHRCDVVDKAIPQWQQNKSQSQTLSVTVQHQNYRLDLGAMSQWCRHDVAVAGCKWTLTPFHSVCTDNNKVCDELVRHFKVNSILPPWADSRESWTSICTLCISFGNTRLIFLPGLWMLSFSELSDESTWCTLGEEMIPMGVCKSLL